MYTAYMRTYNSCPGADGRAPTPQRQHAARFSSVGLLHVAVALITVVVIKQSMVIHLIITIMTIIILAIIIMIMITIPRSSGVALLY